jgi:hypothetical protein
MLSEFFTYSHLAGLLSVAAGLIFFGWMIFRTRSWHVFKHFLWRMFNGKSGVADPIISGYLGEQSSLMLFRFMAVDAETIRDAHDMIAWSKERNIGLETLGRAGAYFDPQRRCMNQKKMQSVAFDRKAFTTAAIFFVTLIAPVFLSLVTSRAILVFKDSGRWFLFGQDTARTLFVRGAEELSKDQCSGSGLKDAAKFGFSQSDASNICKFWQAPETSAYVEKTVHQQRVAGGWLLFIFGLFSFRSWRGAGEAKAAQAVRDRLALHGASAQEPVEQ